MTFTWSLLVVMVMMMDLMNDTAGAGQTVTKTWVQDIRPGYKINLNHYHEVQVDNISEFVRVVPVISVFG